MFEILENRQMFTSYGGYVTFTAQEFADNFDEVWAAIT
jgi:hypothetical protein